MPWAAPSFVAIKGIVHAPSTTPAMKPESRNALLGAIAKARRWIEDLRLGRVESFAEIAEREALGERHIRLLTPLAFVSPRSRGNRRGCGADRPHGHRSCQGVAVFLGRAGAARRALKVLTELHLT
jgi:hypothetical protein